jgi:tRNA (adenine57-N1/adenine58-N1)-methyltransferase
MWSSAREIAAGDTVIVWLTRDQVQPLVVTPGKDFNTKFGNFKQSDFIGVPYGSKVVPKSGRGFIYILRPTPELWTIALPHRTQILYLADIAFIVSWLAIKKGSKVIEAGKNAIRSFCLKSGELI